MRWSKDERFDGVLDLPRRARARFELALANVDEDSLARLTAYGWRVIDAVALTKDLLPYRDYVRGSGAEFTVAKAQNVCLRSGWFSAERRWSHDWSARGTFRGCSFAARHRPHRRHRSRWWWEK